MLQPLVQDRPRIVAFRPAATAKRDPGRCVGQAQAQVKYIFIDIELRAFPRLMAHPSSF
jgi:hypothetical protein